MPALGAEARRELADRRGLAGAVDADHQDDEGLRQPRRCRSGLRDGREHLLDLAGEHGAHLARARRPGRCARAPAPRRCAPAVSTPRSARMQQLLEFVERRASSLRLVKTSAMPEVSDCEERDRPDVSRSHQLFAALWAAPAAETGAPGGGTIVAPVPSCEASLRRRTVPASVSGEAGLVAMVRAVSSPKRRPRKLLRSLRHHAADSLQRRGAGAEADAQRKGCRPAHLRRERHRGKVLGAAEARLLDQHGPRCPDLVAQAGAPARARPPRRSRPARSFTTSRGTCGMRAAGVPGARRERKDVQEGQPAFLDAARACSRTSPPSRSGSRR